MSRSAPPDRVPTLTEVVELPAGGADTPVTLGAHAPAPAPAPAAASAGPHNPGHDAELARRLVNDLQLHVDRVLDARLKAAIEPALEQLVARVLAETRRELASTLRDGIARALAQELSRHRGEPAQR